MRRRGSLLVLLLMLAASGELAALETVRGILREASDFQCSAGCGTYYVEPEPGYQVTKLGGNFRSYIDLRVEITGYRDDCSGCLVLFASEPVIVLPPLAVGDEDPVPIPREVRLMQNYPNPFNPTTTIEYALAGAAAVRLTVSTLLGEEVAVLVDAVEPPGIHRKSWSAGTLPGGVYFCRLRVTAGGRTTAAARSMILLR